MDITIHEYLKLLNEEIDNRFPNTIKVIIRGGDYIKDVYMEFREDNSRMQYCPYEMFINSDGNYEDSILELCSEWERLISK